MTPTYSALLKDFIGFKSISTDSAFLPEIQKTAQWLQNLFLTYGFSVELWEGKQANPVVFANFVKDPILQTILVYGHYDVQPAEKADGWDPDPFTVLERNGRLYARGIVDNKGQVLVHIATVLDLVKSGGLKYNVKFLVEGNEETSNPELGGFIAQYKDKLKSDYILISDGEILGQSPVVEFSLRGGFNCKLSYKTGANNLHSGMFGGIVPNAAQELAYFLTKTIADDNKVKIKGFYDDVDEIPKEIAENNKKLTNDKEFMKSAGVSKLFKQKGYDIYSQVGLLPTITPTGFKSGYIGEGFSNIVPNTAEVRLNFRTVASQDYNKLIEQFKKFVQKNTYDYIEYELTFSEPYNPVKIDITSPKVEQAKRMLTQAFKKETLTKPVGGGIPVVSDFKEHLGIDSLLISLGNEDCNMHGVNENFDIAILDKGLKFSEMFFSS